MLLVDTLIRVMCLQLAAVPLSDRLFHDARVRDVAVTIDQGVHDVTRALERMTCKTLSTHNIQHHIKIVENHSQSLCVDSLKDFFSNVSEDC